NVILEKITIDLEDEVVNLLEKEKLKLETIESLKSNSLESSEKVSSELENQSKNDCLVVENECNKEENPKQTSSLRPYVPNVILEKIIVDLEHEVVSLLEKEKANLETIESLKSKENQSENDCLVVEKECDKKENSNVIAPGMFKLNVSHYVSPILMLKLSCDSNNAEIKLERKRRKRKSSKQNVKQVDNDVSRANNDFVHFSDLDTFSSVRRPKNIGVIWKKKGSSNTSNVSLSAVCDSNLKKNVKRYSRKDLMNDLLDDNNFFIFDDESIKISPVSKMPFRKKSRDSMNIVQICLWIIDSGCSKHMTGNRALLTNFVEKFLGTVRFGNNDFAVIAGYGDVVIGSMKIKKVYYVEGLGHNLFSVGQFCDKGLEVANRKSAFFVRNKNGVDLLTVDRLLNLYTIALNEVASNSSTCLLAKASSSQSWLWHQHEASEVIISFIKKTQVNIQLQVQRVQTNNGMEFKNKTLAKFFDDVVSQVDEASKKDLEYLFQDFFDEYFDSSKIVKSSTTNVETSINEEVFHE
nr:integrase, catalytic region, zinc finger, CCHC-type, peptidase aspartic, catalytic [Tanacetum cinerariifolium]